MLTARELPLIVGEESVEWLDGVDPAALPYVRESLQVAHRRRGRPRSSRRIVAWANLRHDVPSEHPSTWHRRVWWLSSHDPYADGGWPMEAVDPLSIAPRSLSNDPVPRPRPPKPPRREPAPARHHHEHLASGLPMPMRDVGPEGGVHAHVHWLGAIEGDTDHRYIVTVHCHCAVEMSRMFASERTLPYLLSVADHWPAHCPRDEPGAA